MRIAKAGRTGKPTEERGPTFTGQVWADPVLAAEDGIMANNVYFEPGSRTHWHTHATAQVLHVLAGEEHWHGAAPGSFLLHLAVSVGSADWLDPVSEDDYSSAVKSG